MMDGMCFLDFIELFLFRDDKKCSLDKEYNILYVNYFSNEIKKDLKNLHK